ncbi:MAG: hypothetical protein Q8L14_04535 [Myxococcales bacterium]|nr:hypothetical protein [Myxococcales bacterium]
MMTRLPALLVVASLSLFAGCLGAPPKECTACGDVCVNLVSDSKNCGACNKVCAGGTRCENSACVSTNAGTTSTECSLDCGASGKCVKGADGGAASCQCLAGFTGDRCDRCKTGFQDNDADGICAPDCSGTTCMNGTCADTTGAARCVCRPGYAGVTCEVCAIGFQDNDRNGVCEATCAMTTTCNNGTCSDSSGRATCVCTGGFMGAACNACNAGLQDNDGDGVCRPQCTTTQCGTRGTCSDATGTALCTCSGGYTGLTCSTCAPGLQDNDTNGTCTPACAANQCGANGTCSDSTGTAVCTCAMGYAGADCRACGAGLQDNDANGSCLPSCQGAMLTCTGGAICTDVSGTASCSCPAGYTGPTCTQCAVGFQDEDGDGRCALPCTTRPFLSDAGTARQVLNISNPSPAPLSAGTLVFAELAPPLSGWALNDGGGIAVVLQEPDGGVRSIGRDIALSTDGGSRISFRLAAPVAAGTTSRDYSLYRSTTGVAAQGFLGAAVRVDDASRTLVCDLRGNFFFSIQLRQLAPQQYEINVADGTGDGSAYARITITDLVTGTVLRDTTFNDGAGSCCTAPTYIARVPITITSRVFRVRTETREFSGTHRFYGCDDFGTGNPPTSQIGVSDFIYVVSDSSATAVACGGG